MKRKESTPRREELVAAVDRSMRESSALGVMFSHALAGRLGITPTDLECLDVIGFRDRVTAGDLARATGLTTGAITAVIDRLEKAGFATRERDPEDRRRVYVKVLPAGLKRVEPHYRPLATRMAEVLAGYSDKELALLADFFARGRAIMAAAIEEAAKRGDSAVKSGRSVHPRIKSPRP